MMKHPIPRSLKSVSKSIAAGISAAGIVNTAAPGLFPATLGYIAGSLRGTGFAAWMVKLGIFSLGAFSTPTISNYGILAVGAVVGCVLGLLWLPIRPLTVIIHRWSSRKWQAQRDRWREKHPGRHA